MLEWNIEENTWEPPELRNEDVEEWVFSAIPGEARRGIWFLVLQTEPFMDALLISFREDAPTLGKDPDAIEALRRLTFQEGYTWKRETEELFEKICLNDGSCKFHHGQLDEVFRTYSQKYPQWHLQRYYTQDFRLLDHIYQCCRKNTAKEILYKAGLDELALAVKDLDEENLLAKSPSEIFGGVSMRCLRALNCREGAKLLLRQYGRDYVKGLAKRFPEVFAHALNDAQCRYLNTLGREKLTINEAGRLFLARRLKLMEIWNDAQYEMFRHSESDREDKTIICEMDPIYKNYLKNATGDDSYDGKFYQLRFYLLHHREKYDREFRRANRLRADNWQERDQHYVIRYPQTINDFCREAIYMSNCLFGYVDAFLDNTTTILFMRRVEDVNTPFITLEIFDNKLMQAYHRFNKLCDEEEERWIIYYCWRHGINTEHYLFGD